MLTAECADTVSDPSEESLVSNDPGVYRKEVREEVRDMGWYSGCWGSVMFQNPIPNMFWMGMARFSWV
jgi:hypothetical protein